MSKFTRFFGRFSTVFNPTWKANKLLFFGLFYLCVSFWSSYDTYRRGELKKIQVENVSQTSIRTVVIGGNSIEVSQKSELLFKPKSYGQQLIFDLNPNEDNIFSLSFALPFFIITIVLFFFLRNTSKNFQFSRSILNVLTKLHLLVYVVVLIKILIVFQFNSYISNLIGPQIHLTHSFNSIGLGTAFIYGLFSTFLFTIINFFKQGLALQEEQDLTV